MKPIFYNIMFILFLIPSISVGNGNTKMKGKYTKEKSIKKEFSVNDNALLKVNNDYGNIDITSWNENKTIIEITIKVNGDDEEMVIEKLKNIDVKFENNSQLVHARTVFDKIAKSWWEKISSSWSGNNLKMEINYMIKVPITNNLDLANDYGSITLDKIEGNVKISCDYGQIILGELLGNDNHIGFDYTNNSSIKYMKIGKIDADYSDFTLEKGEEIKLNANYTKSKLTAIKNLNYKCDYGNLKIGNVKELKGNGDYLDVNIGTIGNSANINSGYGSLDIEKLESTIKNVTIKTDYTSVDMGYDTDLNFDFSIKTSYGGITLNEDIILMKKNKEHNSKDYKGYHGQKNSGTYINISTSYGGVKLRKNNH